MLAQVQVAVLFAVLVLVHWELQALFLERWRSNSSRLLRLRVLWRRMRQHPGRHSKMVQLHSCELVGRSAIRV